ncbi:30S ribosomal protein S17 [Candidatus Woesearchaeota archaeon]|nr:30S ribosomal protein S17 [Candidatus Woesearchaeota archaeon]
MSKEITAILEEGRKNIKAGSTRKDSKCPFTGGLKLRGKTFTGIVVSKDTHRTVKVEWTTRQFVKKYERFMVKRTKVAAHNPEVINAQVGDVVIIAECKPLSKTKKFVVIKNLGHSLEYAIKKESIEDDKKVKEGKKPVKKEANAEDVSDDSDNSDDEQTEEDPKEE